jgi:hypothetical protein
VEEDDLDAFPGVAAASILAARSRALLFVRGAILGAITEDGRGRTFAGGGGEGGDSASATTGEPFVGVGVCVPRSALVEAWCGSGRVRIADAGRGLSSAVWEAGRRWTSMDVYEFVREIPGVLGVVEVRTVVVEVIAGEIRDDLA